MLGWKATDAKFLQILIAAINVIGKDNNSNMNQFSPLSVREIPRSRYSHATTLQHLRARKLARRTRSVHSPTRAPAKLVSMIMDFRAFVAKAPHLTIPRQRTLVYGGKLLFSNATAKIHKAISQKRHDGFSFFNDGNLDKCLSKKKSRLATPALWLSSPHWAKCMTNSYPLRSPSK